MTLSEKVGITFAIAVSMVFIIYDGFQLSELLARIKTLEARAEHAEERIKAVEFRTRVTQDGTRLSPLVIDRNYFQGEGLPTYSVKSGSKLPDSCVHGDRFFLEPESKLYKCIDTSPKKWNEAIPK